MKTTQKMIIAECESIKELLLLKNKEYGNSAIMPQRIFSRSDNIEQINVRIDDKLSRMMNQGHKEINEDTDLDLIGYLILRRVAIKYNKTAAHDIKEETPFDSINRHKIKGDPWP